ncbi:MAG: hypothetical protein QMD43_02980 [Thermodesulfovibrio sp.]|nr:hypothetical protein [Thermodesulfovibrio sp.]
MKFQIKIIIAFSLTLAVILFYLNTMVINFIDYMKEDLILELQDKRAFIKRDFIEDKFQEYVKNVLLWEFLLVLSLMLILYKVIERITKQERDYKELLELILLTLSHKFGNFLTSHRGNIEILKLRNDERALQRLEKSCTFMQEDLNKVIETINRFKEASFEKEKINLKELIEKFLSLIETEKRILITAKDINVYANRQNLENIVFPLLENALRYSKERIHIKVCKNYLAIRNDIYETERGSGIGLKIAQALAKKEGFKIKYRAKEDSFILILKFT